VVEWPRPTADHAFAEVVLKARPRDEKYEAEVVENPSPAADHALAEVVEKA
jgi:hypothetical protein